MQWISVDSRLPDITSGKFRVKRSNGDEMDAFYYMDAMCWIAFYGLKTSNWWNAKGQHERLDDVTHWKE